ncbi:MAG: alpha-ketoacid dehydrogenase subunit beta [Ruminococcaceae bacterium]|nr:alpha-ketoacid dehydrogenase subunit beta [Oscillospiraceae bacterium]
MRNMNMTFALRDTLRQEMKRDERVFLVGEDLRQGTFRVTVDLHKEFGEERVIDTPISEKAVMGAAIGAATVGLIPVPEIMFADFFTCCFDEIMNQMAKMRYMFGGQCSLPITLRMPCGISRQAAAQHSQSIEAFLTHIPGLKVVYSGTAKYTPGLLVSAIRDPDPVIFLEHKKLYRDSADIGDEDQIEPVPFGKACVRREGKDITLVATGAYVNDCVKIADAMAEQGLDIEVIDPLTLFPLDTDTIYKSVEKTGKLLVVTEENLRGAWSGELVSIVAQDRFSALKKAPIRVGALDTPIAFSPPLEEYIVPREKDIVQAIMALK